MTHIITTIVFIVIIINIIITIIMLSSLSHYHYLIWSLLPAPLPFAQ
jgi:hypothetical protein